MEGSHHYSGNHAQNEQEEERISSLDEEINVPLQEVPRLLHSQNAQPQVARRWTLTEMLVLVREKVIVENEILHGASKTENNGRVSDKWNLVSSHCKASKVERTADQCRKKWESLLSDYKKIKGWEFQHQTQSSWKMNNNSKKQHKLPSYMERELFATMDVHLNKVPIRSSRATVDSMDTGANCLFTIEDDFQDNILEVQDPSPSGNSPEPQDTNQWKRQRRSPESADDIEHAIATAICENSENIQSLLREATQAKIRSHQLEREMYWRGVEQHRELQLRVCELDRELSRKQSEDLIQVLGGLANAINHLVDAIQSKRSQ